MSCSPCDNIDGRMNSCMNTHRGHMWRYIQESFLQFPPTFPFQNASLFFTRAFPDCVLIAETLGTKCHQPK